MIVNMCASVCTDLVLAVLNECNFFFLHLLLCLSLDVDMREAEQIQI